MGLCSSSENVPIPEENDNFATLLQLVEQEKKETPHYVTRSVYAGKTFEAYVNRCIDGDTVDLDIFAFQRKVRLRTRLQRIDTPEMSAEKKAEREAAKLAKEKLQSLFMQVHNCVIVKFAEKQNDPYGRHLAEIWAGKTNVSDWMLQQQLAYEYYGRKKKTWGEYSFHKEVQTKRKKHSL